MTRLARLLLLAFAVLVAAAPMGSASTPSATVTVVDGCDDPCDEGADDACDPGCEHCACCPLVPAVALDAQIPARSGEVAHAAPRLVLPAPRAGPAEGSRPPLEHPPRSRLA